MSSRNLLAEHGLEILHKLRVTWRLRSVTQIRSFCQRSDRFPFYLSDIFTEKKKQREEKDSVWFIKTNQCLMLVRFGCLFGHQKDLLKSNPRIIKRTSVSAGKPDSASREKKPGVMELLPVVFGNSPCSLRFCFFFKRRSRFNQFYFLFPESASLSSCPPSLSLSHFLLFRCPPGRRRGRNLVSFHWTLVWIRFSRPRRSRRP